MPMHHDWMGGCIFEASVFFARPQLQSSHNVKLSLPFRHFGKVYYPNLAYASHWVASYSPCEIFLF